MLLLNHFETGLTPKCKLTDFYNTDFVNVQKAAQLYSFGNEFQQLYIMPISFKTSIL